MIYELLSSTCFSSLKLWFHRYGTLFSLTGNYSFISMELCFLPYKTMVIRETNHNS
ncbi:hypothetical protein PRABACTJOHN_04451 [Parabacteroides johnsonii DSM 18315]|uniref:Uncharacterized protein n=1 Tax=Parabacteroides johnsonii DSM 18315 TaxID=537006 RepID=B7BHA2_9BACT|nr:hypothetical protein PRABACTJOHN_04451 [Parabacteroides johnsonii DSM 18315]